MTTLTDNRSANEKYLQDTLGVQSGSDYTLGKNSLILLDRALTHYGEHLRSVSFELRRRKIEEKAALNIDIEAKAVIDLSNIFDASFEIVAHGVGEG